MIRDQVINKCASNNLRHRLLCKADLKLDGLLQIARLIEAAYLHATTTEADSELPQQQVNQIASDSQSQDTRRRKKGPKKPKNSGGKDKGTKQGVCFCCGCVGHCAKDPSCPAVEKQCGNCGKQVCKSALQMAEKRTGSGNVLQHRNGLRYVTTKYELLDDEYLFSIGDTKEATTVPINIGNTLIPVIIDSGTSVNVLDSATSSKLAENRFVLRRSTVKIYLSKEHSVPMCQCLIFTHLPTLWWWNFNAGSLLGKKTATALGLLQVGPEQVSKINQITMGSTQAIVEKHDAVFRGVARLKDYQLKIHIDLEVTPVPQPQRRVSFHVRKDVEKKLQELQDLNILEDVESPTPWVSPLVAVPKSNGDVRVCVDMHRANEAVIRERHPIPTLEETLAPLNGAAVFSKLALRWGYHQVELDPESRALTM